MVLRYRFHKEILKDGSVAFRPLVLVDINYDDNHLPFNVAALLDSGCDVTIIPQSFAKLLKLKEYEETELIAYKEKTKVLTSKANMTFLGRVERENVKLTSVPVFITPDNDDKFLPEVVIGVRGIFDKFEIKFNLGQNKIELKKMDTLRRKLYY